MSAPSSPLLLHGEDWKAAAKGTAAEFKDDRASLTAAGMAFYWFLAVFPTLIAAVGLIGFLNLGPATTDSVVDTIRSALPADAADVLVEAVDRADEEPKGGSVVAAVFGLALALFGASSGMVAMQNGLDVAYDVSEPRSWFKRRLVGLGLVVATLIVGGISTILTVFGKPLGEALARAFGLGAVFDLAWTPVRLILSLAALGFLFAIFYGVAPNRQPPRITWLSPGAALAAVIWLLASLGFSLYVSSIGNYAETYGSLAGVVVLLLWLYLTALAVILGGELNAELERRASEASPNPTRSGEDKTLSRTNGDGPRSEGAGTVTQGNTLRVDPNGTVRVGRS
ncbi:MAG: YihY/virulence factor BrkB family protein [Acidimicrobiales bacterium]